MQTRECIYLRINKSLKSIEHKDRDFKKPSSIYMTIIYGQIRGCVQLLVSIFNQFVADLDDE